jgi:hypothetical protein
MQNALKLLSLDIDSMIKKGIFSDTNQKGRQAELHIAENDEKDGTDLSGENCLNHIDGISKNNEPYDVKGSKLYDRYGGYWQFVIDKFEDVNFYYLIGYDKERKNILHKWKISSYDFIDIDYLVIGNNNSWRYNLENMKEFEL